MKMRKRSIFPISLIGIGLFLLVGCIYIPYIGSTGQQISKAGADVSVLGGAETSKRFQDQFLHTFKVGISTREQVLSEMPYPQFARSDRKALIYLQHRTSGYWVYPVCFFYAGPQEDVYHIELDFDERVVVAKTTRDVEDHRQMHQYPWMPDSQHSALSPIKG